MNDIKEGDRVKVIGHPYIPDGTIVTINYIAGNANGIEAVVPEGEYSGYNIFPREIRKLTKLERVL